MASVRIRWGGVARVAAIVVVGLLALRLLPGLLRAPEPPPLAADVGLPQAKPVRTVAEPQRRRPPRKRKPHLRKHHRRVHPKPKARPEPIPDGPASTTVIGSRHERRIKRAAERESPETHPKPTTEPVPESAPPQVPEYVPVPPPEPVAEPLPDPAPAPSSTPGDGSEEFAPH